MADEQIPAPVVEGAAPDTAVQETPQVVQTTPEPQETTPIVVDNGSKEPQVPDTSRRKPSDYYQERKTIRELKEQYARLEAKLQEKESLKDKPKPDEPVADFDPAHFSPDHKRILVAREKSLRDSYDAKIAALEQKINGWQETKAQDETNRRHQEALEKYFPKSSPDAKETLEERIQRDPARAQRLRSYLVESGLNELSKTNPELALEIAIQKIDGDKPKPNPTVLKKNMMGATATGNPGMGEKRSVTEQDLVAEKNKLNTQLDANPALRHDPKFMERRAQILSDIERLVTKK